MLSTIWASTWYRWWYRLRLNEQGGEWEQHEKAPTTLTPPPLVTCAQTYPLSGSMLSAVAVREDSQKPSYTLSLQQKVLLAHRQSITSQ
jgi:hypothetical protein